ncbi:MAG TPA: GYF domain-containing protein, partial [Polyangiaceae bacterium]
MATGGEPAVPLPNEPAKFMSATEAFLALQSTPPPNAAHWSVCLSQTDTRRMSTDEIVQAVLKGTIKTAVFVWRNGMGNWLRLNEVPELVAVIMKAGGRVPQARATAEPKLPAGSTAYGTPSVGPPKPAAPARHQTLRSQFPPQPTPSVLPARSGQTMPPPSAADQPAAPLIHTESKADATADKLTPDVDARVGKETLPANNVDAVALTAGPGRDTSTASVAPSNGTVRRNTPAPPQRRATLGFPGEIEVPIPPDPALPSPGRGITLPPLTGGEVAAVATAAAAGLATAASHQTLSSNAIALDKASPEGDPKAAAAALPVAATTTSEPVASSSFDTVPPAKPTKTK